MRVFFHATVSSNLDLIATEGLVPKIGPRSMKAGEEEGVFLFPNIDECETALMQWLGFEFEETEPNEDIVILKIALPSEFPLFKTCEWEYVSRETIAPKYINFFKYEECCCV